MTNTDSPNDPCQPGAPLLACEHCDTLYSEPPLSTRAVAICRRCGQVLHRGGVPDANLTFALSLTALVIDVFANVYPVISVEVQDRHNAATLVQAVLAMAHGYSVPMAIVLGLAMVVAPTLQIGLLAWVTGYARLGRRAPGFRAAMRLLELARPWSMVEVFLIGALVAVVKLSAFLEVLPGVGIYSLASLAFLVTLLAGRSTRGLWRLDPDAVSSPVAAGEVRVRHG